jgi:Gpi18-like mannosyltransferase
LTSARRLAPPWLLRDVLLPFAASRAVLLVVALVAITVLPMSPFVPAEWTLVPDHPLLAAFARWDGKWYLEIAANGYTYTPGAQSSVSFFPLFPALIGALGDLVGRTDPSALALSGILVSNAALLMGACYLVALVRLDRDEDTAARAARYLFFFPTSLFLSAVYADAVLLAVSAAAFYHARRDQWWLAGLFGAFAALSRPHGVILAAPLALEYLHQRGFALRRIRLDALALLLPFAGLGVYVAYLGATFGAPFAFVETQHGWDRSLTMPWDTLARFFSQPLTWHRNEHSWVDLGFLLLLGGVAVAAWRLVRPSYALFVTLILLAALSSGSLLSLMRVGVSLFPVHIVLALVTRDERADRLLLAGSAAVGALFMAMFARWYWVA